MRRAILFMLIVGVTFSGASRGRAATSPGAAEGRALFQAKCSKCHTIGEGRKVGPDLSGITQIRPRGYLVDLISNATHMFATGNSIAVMVLEQYRTIRMPNLNLSGDQVLGILAYIEAESAKPRPAAGEEPVKGNPDIGRKLFDGNIRFRNGGPPCISCHNISHLRFPMGGSMGPNLTDINARFAAVDAPHVFPTMIPLYIGRPLLPDEQQNLEAFIAKAALDQSTDETAALALLAELAFVFAAVGVWIIWRKRIGIVRNSLRAGQAPPKDQP